MNTIAELNVQISHIDQLIVDARKAKDWDHVHKLYDQYESLVDKCNALSRQLEREQSMHELDDWNDDEKHRDAYNERIVSMYL
jgi:ribonucleotide reductase alpha subunit